MDTPQQLDELIIRKIQNETHIEYEGETVSRSTILRARILNIVKIEDDLNLTTKELYKDNGTILWYLTKIKRIGKGDAYIIINEDVTQFYNAIISSFKKDDVYRITDETITQDAIQRGCIYDRAILLAAIEFFKNRISTCQPEEDKSEESKSKLG